MKKITVIILTLVLLSCTKKSTENQEKVINPNKGIEQKAQDSPKRNTSEFLAEFKTIESTELHVYSRENDKNRDPNKTPFKGNIIHVNNYKLFEDNTLFENLDLYKDGSYHLYAVGKFEINENYTALIIRQYSEYDESLLQLVLWDKKKEEIKKGIDLSDSWGDADFRFIKESWIYRQSNEPKIKIITRKKVGQLTDEFEKEETTDSLKTYIFEGKQFTLVKNAATEMTKLKFKQNWE
jgi:hypothetical protein